jgi:hypothetical protein
MRNLLVIAILLSAAACSEDPKATPSKVFITSTSYTPGVGGFIGISGADQECMARASAGGLSGTYVAFLSDSSTNAKDRITSSGPFYMTNGTTLVFSSKSEFFTASVPDLQDEFGATNNLKAWTGTDRDTGLYAGNSCANWTSSTDQSLVNVGDQESVPKKWMSEGGHLCSDSFQLYCFQVN